MEVAVEGRKLVLGVFPLLQGCNSQEVSIISQEITSRDLTLPEVTRY